MELTNEQKQIAWKAYMYSGTPTTKSAVYAAVAAVLEAKRTPEQPVPKQDGDVPVQTLVNTGKRVRWVLESDHIAALAEATRTEPAPTPHPAGDVLRECMAIFNGPPDQPDGNGMNAVIRIARRGYYSAEEIEEAVVDWLSDKRGHRIGNPGVMTINILARLSLAQEQKEKQ